MKNVVTLRFMDISLYQQQKKRNRTGLPVLATNFKFFQGVMAKLISKKKIMCLVCCGARSTNDCNE